MTTIEISPFYCQEYKSIVDNTAAHLLLDVRPLVEVDICHLPTSLSILMLAECPPLIVLL